MQRKNSIPLAAQPSGFGGKSEAFNESILKMDIECEIIRCEIADVRQIVYNECWLEGERRGCAVDAHDGVIQERVAQIILECAGAVIRGKYTNLLLAKPETAPATADPARG